MSNLAPIKKDDRKFALAVIELYRLISIVELTPAEWDELIRLARPDAVFGRDKKGRWTRS
jgi:hypothetical protein